MFEIFAVAVMAVLSLLGLSELVHMLSSLILRPKQKAKSILVLIPSDSCAEEQIQATLQQMSWYGKNYADYLAVLTDNLSQENKAKCKNRFFGNEIIYTENKEFCGEVYDRGN